MRKTKIICTIGPACDNETIKAIAEVLGVEPVTVEPKMSYVHCNGDAAAKERLTSLIVLPGAIPENLSPSISPRAV